MGELGRGSGLEACPLLTSAQGGSTFKRDPLSSGEGGEALHCVRIATPGSPTGLDFFPPGRRVVR